jgi:heparan-alpha-glucosaminide N-acetyltransferase
MTFLIANGLVFFLVSSFLLVKCSLYAQVKGAEDNEPDWKCIRVQSLLTFEFAPSDPDYLNTHDVTVYYQYTECKRCPLIPLIKLSKNMVTNKFYGHSILDAHFDFFFKVVSFNANDQQNQTLCEQFKFTKFGECGRYHLDIGKCSIETRKSPNNIYIGLYVGFPIILVIIVLFNLVERYQAKGRKLVARQLDKAGLGPTARSVADVDNVEKETDSGRKKVRYRSLDAFRGLSILIMIFVTYGYFTYKFNYHVPWESFNLSSIVMPWFIWIMGVSVPISLNAILGKPNASRIRVFFKILWRSVKLFAIGLILNMDYDWKWETIRYFGVLQRISLCYFVLALVELIFWKKIDTSKHENTWKYYVSDLIYALPHSAVVAVILLVWFLVVYLLPVPGCPTGYFGPGGIQDGGKYFNCTGGATGYIDELLLGESHLYIYPTQMQIYQTVKNYEPEGIMGTLTSIVLAYFGVIAGRVLIFYSSKRRHIFTFAVWCLLTFALFAGLSQFDMADGAVPVVKNIWTFSFTLVSASTAFLLQICFYFIIDVKQYWNGNPFIYVGCNSLFIYICHYLFVDTFPVQWKQPNFHTAKFFMCIWGGTFWTLIAAYLFSKDVFFNI